MSVPLSPSRRQALKTASQWYSVLSDDRVSPRQAARWQQWYDQDNDNQWAWQQVENLRQQMGQLPQGIASRALQDSRVTRRHVLKGLLLLACAGGGWQGWETDLARGMRADYRTAKGMPRHQQLSDGTLLILNTDSAADIQFDTRQRLIQLRYGEIAITTGKDSLQRPFQVQTREGLLTALGTRFTVRQFPGGTHLAVQQHAVNVTLPGGQQLRVNAGKSLWFTRDSFAALLPLDENDDSWTRGVLNFRDTPLETVITTLARYRPGILRCDPAVAGLRLSGSFPLGNTDNALRTISRTLPVKLHIVTRYWISVVPAENK